MFPSAPAGPVSGCSGPASDPLSVTFSLLFSSSPGYLFSNASHTYFLISESIISPFAETVISVSEMSAIFMSLILLSASLRKAMGSTSSPRCPSTQFPESSIVKFFMYFLRRRAARPHVQNYSIYNSTTLYFCQYRPKKYCKIHLSRHYGGKRGKRRYAAAPENLLFPEK